MEQSYRLVSFNDNFRLTELVLKGEVSQFYHVIDRDHIDISDFMSTNLYHDQIKLEALYIPMYKEKEVLAIAQTYKDIGLSMMQFLRQNDTAIEEHYHIGCNNKLLVKSSMMPHHIRINSIKVKRIQDVDVDDCLSLGVLVNPDKTEKSLRYGVGSKYFGTIFDDTNARDAFSYMVTQEHGYDVWRKNPYCVFYKFNLLPF